MTPRLPRATLVPYLALTLAVPCLAQPPAADPAGAWLASGELGIVRLARLPDGSLSGSFDGSITAPRQYPGHLWVREMGDGFAGTWSEDDARRGGFLWLRLLEQGAVASGWLSTVKSGASDVAWPGRREAIFWNRLSVTEPVKRIERGDLKIEVYADRKAFIARLAGAVRGVDFDDINMKKRDDPVAFATNRYAASHGLLIEGQKGQFASRGFGYPKNYRPASGANMFAPGPAVVRDFLAPLRDRLQADHDRLLAAFERAKEAVRRIEASLAGSPPAEDREPDALTGKRLRMARAELARQLAALRAVDHQLAVLTRSGSAVSRRGGSRGTTSRTGTGERGGHTTALAFRRDSRRAAVAGFGAAFIDADYPYVAPSKITLFDATGKLIADEGGFSGPDGQGVFRGLVVIGTDGRPAPVIARVQITNGQEWPGYGAGEGVALDDFVYGIPRPINARPD